MVPKLFAVEPFSVSLVSGTKNPKHISGLSQFPVEKVLSHNTNKIVGEPFCVSEMLCYQKNFGQ